MYHHSQEGQPLSCFSRCHLRDRRGFDKLLSLILERSCPVREQTCCVKPHSHLRQFVLDLLKIDQRLLKTRPGLRITYCRLVSCLSNADTLRGHVHAPPIVRLHPNVESVTFLSDQIVRRNLDVIKNQFRGLGASKTCRFDMAAALEAFCSSFNNERAQAFVPLLAAGGWTCPREDQVEVCDFTVRDERLLAADLPVGPVKFGR